VEFFSRCQDELVSPDDYQKYADEQAENFRPVRGAMAEDERSVRDMEIAKLLKLEGLSGSDCCCANASCLHLARKS